MKIRAVYNALIYARDVLFELLWPTRCAVCDIAGEYPICDSCISKLKVIDACMACPECGAPYGIAQCTECNDLMLASSGLDALPFDSMASAFILDEAARRVICAYKDQDERRLCEFIARAIALQVGPEVLDGRFTLTYIPDSREAYRRRGFDHSLEIAQDVASITGIECKTLFQRPSSTDQRKLGRHKRIENMRNRIAIAPQIDVPENVLLIDDVCTTGATIYSACLELKRYGTKRIYVVTFGRVLA